MYTEMKMSRGELVLRTLFNFAAKILITMWCWNALMQTFGLHELSFVQSMLAVTLSECLFQPWPIVKTDSE